MFAQAANPSASFADTHKMFSNPRTPDKLIELTLTLEQLSVTHEIDQTIVRSIQDEYMRTRYEEIPVKIPIKAGWKSGTKITFEKHGDQTALLGSGNVVFVINEAKHPFYKRKGDNLHCKVEINLHQALNGGEFRFKDLISGTSKRCTFDRLPTSQAETVITGHGMPLLKNPTQRGNLIVKFIINFTAGK